MRLGKRIQHLRAGVGDAHDITASILWILAIVQNIPYPTSVTTIVSEYATSTLVDMNLFSIMNKFFTLTYISTCHS